MCARVGVGGGFEKIEDEVTRFLGKVVLTFLNFNQLVYVKIINSLKMFIRLKFDFNDPFVSPSEFPTFQRAMHT